MGRGGRRALLALILAAVGLSAARTIAEFLTDRWWFLDAAPQAYPFHLRRNLLGFALDLWAVLLAALWWIAHGRALLTAARDPSTAAGGNPVVRRALRHPDAKLWVTLLGATLAVLMGLGAEAWTDPLMLAWQEVHFDVVDPALGLDLGVFLAQLPFWLRLHAFLTALVLSTLGVIALGHLLAGSIRFGRTGLVATETSRRQLGSLLALLAAVIAVQQALLPYQLAAGLPEPIDPAVVRLQRSVTFVLIGVSFAVVLLSALWALRPVHKLAAGGWLALTLALAVSTYALPDGTPWPNSLAAGAIEERFEAIGVRYMTDSTSPWAGPTPVPALWDDLALVDVAQGARVVEARLGGPAHAVMREDAPDGFHLFVAPDDSAGEAGEPLFITSADPRVLSAVPAPLAALPALSVHPDAPWVLAGAGPGGLPAGGFLRRLAMGWALQSARVVGADPGEGLLIYGDPETRLRRVAPFVRWEPPLLILVDGRLTWRSQGLVFSESFPASRRFLLDGVRVGYARPGVVGLIDAVTGRVELFLHPDAGPVAQAWSVASGGALLAPSAQLPRDAVGSLEYVRTLFAVHADLWARGEARRAGRDTLPSIAFGAAEPGRLAAVIHDSTDLIVAVLTAHTDASGHPRLKVWRPREEKVEAPTVLQRRWERLPALSSLRDSVTATGGRLIDGGTRTVPTDSGLLSYRPVWALPRTGEPRLSLITSARGNTIAAGRTYPEAVRNLRSAQAEEIGPAAGESEAIFEARRLLRLADSAFRRGDLAEFGRAFAALRHHLERADSSRPPAESTPRRERPK